MDKKSKKRRKSSSNYYSKTNSSSSSSEDEWVEAPEPEPEAEDEIKLKNKKSHRKNCSKKECNSPKNKREDWMNLTANLPTTTSHLDARKMREIEKKSEIPQYDPSKSSRELNVYWKDGGDGLPKFKKPSMDENNSFSNIHKSSSHRWKKTDEVQPLSSSEITAEIQNSSTKTNPEKDLNLLAGKLVKAEIMGDNKLVAELREKLENARKLSLTTSNNNKQENDFLLLTETNRQGHSKPLTLNKEYDYYSKPGKHNQRKKPEDTHRNQQRVKYYPDDDKYSLKELFQRESFNTTNDQDKEFMNAACAVRKNDEFDDFFTDNVRRKKSDNKMQENVKNKSINEHKKITTSLEHCTRCIQSDGIQKHLIISLGEYVYLSIPNHQPLVDGHCLISPIRHVTRATQLDENEWEEIKNFRKALVKLYQSKKQEPVFFEIALSIHNHPHMVIECIPLDLDAACLAPMYFKKAIDESETEWSQNKKLVLLKNRDVRQAIPKELAYFFVSFAMDEGFAHVIEDEKMFPKNFAQEIIGGILDLDHSLWRKPIREKFEEQSKRALKFCNEWKNFDCTQSTPTKRQSRVTESKMASTEVTKKARIFN